MKKTSVILLGLFILYIGSVHINVYAKSEYSKIYAENQKIENGDYTFEYRAGAGPDKATLKIWEGEDDKPIKVLKNMTHYIVFNEENIFYTKDKAILHIDLENFEKDEIAEFKMEPSIEAIKDDLIFFTMYASKKQDEHISSLYRYDINKKEYVLLAKDASECILGEDRLIYTDTKTDVSPRLLSSIDYNGGNYVKLADYTMGAKVIDDKVYYCAYKSENLLKGHIYSSDLDGGNKKRLSRKKIEGYIVDITEEEVVFIKLSGGKFRMDLETGKVRKAR